jgi:hypothetical protein
MSARDSVEPRPIESVVIFFVKRIFLSPDP